MNAQHDISKYAMKNLIRDYVHAKRIVDRYADLLEDVSAEEFASEYVHLLPVEYFQSIGVVQTSEAWMRAVGLYPGSKYVLDIYKEILMNEKNEEESNEQM